MPALKINRFLAAGGDFQPVMEKAREIEALSRLLEGFLPPELAPLARVANFKEGKLVIHAANGPAAAKLKLLSESLGVYISKQRSQVNSVSVRVQPGGGAMPDAAPQKQALMSKVALEELAALYTRLPESAFRKTLKSLLERRGLTP
ncbi:MAG: DUF721 domain-containing protein [Proteobacteria bacterium]|nr:DUF721 domain-containing protein [Pseudomonadota bacterium]